MSQSDPIADALTRIRNSQKAGHETVEMPLNKTIESVLEILKKEGFIEAFYPFKDGVKRMVKVELKYYQGGPVIRGIKRVSTPGRRTYRKVKEIRPFMNSIGINIFSTPKGIMTDKEAQLNQVGGELLCSVW